MLRFCNFGPLSPCACTYAFNLHPLPPSASIQILFFKEDMEENFANYYQSKNNKQRFKVKTSLYKAIGKISNEKPTRTLSLSLFFITGQERWEWIILTI